MRKSPVLFLSVFLFLIFLCSEIWADQVSTSGDQFTLISQGARESALGGDFSAFSDGAFGVFGNPAATGTLQGGDLSLSQIFWFSDTNYETAAYEQSIDQFGTLGAGLSLYWVPAFDNTGGLQSSFSSTSYQVVLSYGTPLGFMGMKGLALGASGRFIGNSFGNLQQTTDAAMDLGLYYQTGWKPLSLGFTLKDISLSAPAFDTLPFSYALGFAISEKDWLVTGEALETAGQDMQAQLGGELWASSFLAFRAGFREQSSSGSYFGPSAGIGLKLGNDFRFDYAAASYGDLGLVHWVSLDITLDRPTPTPVIKTKTIEPIKEQITAAPTEAPVPVITATPISTPKVKPHNKKHLTVQKTVEVIPTPIVTPGFPLRGTVTSGNTVQLSWDKQSYPSGDCVGYNVYVGLVLGAGFKRVTDEPITDTRWSEQTGLHGLTFYYQVKAIGPKGEESLLSEIRPVAVP